MVSTKLEIPSYIIKSQIKGDGLNVVIMPITPEIAAFWLKNYNHSNRPLNKLHVDFLTQQMIAGDWIEMNGDTISFDRERGLNDGQHRLAGIVASGKTFTFVVMVGVDKAAFKVMDTGRSRSGADVLSIEGYKNSALLSAASSFIINFEKGKYHGSSNGGEKGVYKVSNTNISDFVKKNKREMVEFCKLGLSYHSTGDKLVRGSWIVAFLFLFSKKDRKKAERFMFQLATGDKVAHNSGLYRLRRKFYQDKISDTHSIPARTKLAFIVKVWNDMRLEKETNKLQFRYSKGEKFPHIA